MLKNRIFHTKFGDIKTGDEADTEDVKKYFAYRADFFTHVAMFKLKLPNEGRDAQMLYEPTDLFPEELIDRANKEFKEQKRLHLKSQIHYLQEELKEL
jgi:hypothetical protein